MAIPSRRPSPTTANGKHSETGRCCSHTLDGSGCGAMQFKSRMADQQAKVPDRPGAGGRVCPVPGSYFLLATTSSCTKEKGDPEVAFIVFAALFAASPRYLSECRATASDGE